jgi:hypothetical protein
LWRFIVVDLYVVAQEMCGNKWERAHVSKPSFKAACVRDGWPIPQIVVDCRVCKLPLTRYAEHSGWHPHHVEAFLDHPNVETVFIDFERQWENDCYGLDDVFVVAVCRREAVCHRAIFCFRDGVVGLLLHEKLYIKLIVISSRKHTIAHCVSNCLLSSIHAIDPRKGAAAFPVHDADLEDGGGVGWLGG